MKIYCDMKRVCGDYLIRVLCVREIKRREGCIKRNEFFKIKIRNDTPPLNENVLTYTAPDSKIFGQKNHMGN